MALPISTSGILLKGRTMSRLWSAWRPRSRGLDAENDEAADMFQR